MRHFRDPRAKARLAGQTLDVTCGRGIFHGGHPDPGSNKARVLGFIPSAKGKHPLRLACEEVQPDVLRVAAAFATESGADKLRQDIVGRHLFDAAEKHRLIGIQRDREGVLVAGREVEPARRRVDRDASRGARAAGRQRRLVEGSIEIV